MSEAVAILDFGTARTKILVARRSGGRVSYDSASVETRFGDAMDGVASSGSASHGFTGLLDLVGDAANRLGATAFRCIATEAFRSSTQLESVARAIRARFGNLTILDPHTEAKLFYQSVGLVECLEDYFAVDIGGGSVQLVWGVESDQYLTLPLGTYRLEKEYQRRLGIFIEARSLELEGMRHRVLRDLEVLGARFSLPCGRTLVFGSNIMSDFFASAFRAIGLERQAGQLRRGDVDALFNSCSGRRYDELADYFPINPGFLFGADKLLVVVAAVMDALGVPEARVTNASISKGLALAIPE